MNRVSRILLGLGFVALGIWLSIYVMFIGGINAIVSAVDTQSHPGTSIAWACLRLIFCWLPTSVAFAGFTFVLAGPRPHRSAQPSAREVERRWERLVGQDQDF